MKALATGLVGLLLLAFALMGCSGDTGAKEGDTVKVHYTGMLGDGTVFDTSTDREPLEVTLGAGTVIPGFEQGLLGMKVGDSKTITIPVDSGYGPRHEEFVVNVAKTNFPPEINPVAGQQLQMQQPDGRAANVLVVEVGEDSVKIDANHPLAGQILIFDLEVTEIIPGA